jgi:hypothetical protein
MDIWSKVCLVYTELYPFLLSEQTTGCGVWGIVRQSRFFTLRDRLNCRFIVG